MRKLWGDEAWEEYLNWQTQDKKMLKKINRLLMDIDRNGTPDLIVSSNRGVIVDYSVYTIKNGKSQRFCHFIFCRIFQYFQRFYVFLHFFRNNFMFLFYVFIFYVSNI